MGWSVIVLALGACGGGSSESTTSTDTTTSTGTSTATNDCSTAATNIEKVVCAANAYLATLSDDQKASALLAWTDSVAKTRWSNLPGVQRNGPTFGTLSTESRNAAMAVAKAALSDTGYQTFVGILAADDYLGTQQGGMGVPDGGMGFPDGGPPNGDGGVPMGMGGGGTMAGASGYSSDNYSIAFMGTPSTTGNWMLQIGGHHMAWNITYLAGVGYPTPNHLGVEPKGSFTIDSTSYAPLKEKGDALVAIFTALDATTLASAYLTGQVFADVLLGPDEYQTGSYANVVFPTGADRKGVLVSSLSTEQQALVTAAVTQWVRDFDPAVADALMTEYTSAAAYADTYIAWAGTESAGVNVDINGTYMRIDGPRLWIEVDCQGGVVIQGQTHYHTIYRDKAWDYGKSL
ncbi:Hypothetical protein A7982_01080 [Minicystis rosea]|nr:Hypothetical protein A7982_01080 [Minicystis rosea]